MIGLAEVNLMMVVDGGSYNETVNVVERHSGDLIGFLDIELKMEDESRGESLIGPSQLKDDSAVISKDLLFHAAKELETLIEE